jgi:hypothetical protein
MGWRKTETWSRLRAIGALGPQKVIPPRPSRQHDAVGLNRPAIGRDAANPATLDDQAGDLAAEPTVEAVLRSSRVPAEAHLLRVGEAAIGLVGSTGDAVERDLRLDRGDLVGSQESSVEAEAPHELHISAAGLDQPLRHRQEVAAAHVPGISHADLVGPIHDRL